MFIKVNILINLYRVDIHKKRHKEWKEDAETLHEKKIFRLTEILKKDRKDHIFLSFHMFPFYGNIMFYGLSFKQNFEKAASFRKCIFLGLYEIFVYDSWTYCNENKRFFASL